MPTSVSRASFVRALKRKIISEVISAQRSPEDFQLPGLENLSSLTKEESLGLSQALKECYPEDSVDNVAQLPSSLEFADRAMALATTKFGCTGLSLQGDTVELSERFGQEETTWRRFIASAFHDALRLGDASGSSTEAPTFGSVLELMAAEAEALSALTVCGIDTRIPSSMPQVGRLVSELGTPGCTVTMVSPTLGVTAGHCSSLFKFAEFDTPASGEDGVGVSKPENVYLVEEVITTVDQGLGNDYAILKFAPNEVTGIVPGEAQGIVDLDLDALEAGRGLTIVGYGRDDEVERNFAQQVGFGEVSSVRGSTLES